MNTDNSTKRFLLLILATGFLGGCLSSGGSDEDGGTSDGGGSGGGGGTGGNNPPTIGGSPASQVAANSTFSFVPDASDADGDSLSFGIINQPSWTSFSEATGELAGQPDSGDVGMYDNIRVSVTDGTDTTSMAPFSVEVVAAGSGTASVTLNWTAPTQNEDGSDLTDLAGYVIYYGLQSGRYTEEISIDNPSVTTYIVNGLLADTTYYFAATAKNSTDEESRYSGEAAKRAVNN